MSTKHPAIASTYQFVNFEKAPCSTFIKDYFFFILNVCFLNT